jgi:hypothetical protein
MLLSGNRLQPGLVEVANAGTALQMISSRFFLSGNPTPRTLQPNRKQKQQQQQRRRQQQQQQGSARRSSRCSWSSFSVPLRPSKKLAKIAL